MVDNQTPRVVNQAPPESPKKAPASHHVTRQASMGDSSMGKSYPNTHSTGGEDQDKMAKRIEHQMAKYAKMNKKRYNREKLTLDTGDDVEPEIAYVDFEP